MRNEETETDACMGAGGRRAATCQLTLTLLPKVNQQLALLPKVCQLLGLQRMRALDAYDESLIREGLLDALAVLYPGTMQHREQLILAQPPVAAEQAAQDALVKVWEGVVTATVAGYGHPHRDNLVAFVSTLVDHCAEAAGIGFLVVVDEGDKQEPSQECVSASSSVNDEQESREDCISASLSPSLPDAQDALHARPEWIDVPVPVPMSTSATSTSTSSSSTMSRFRTVSFDELRMNQMAPRNGPRAKYEVMALANAIAHERLSGSTRSVRNIAAGLRCCTESGGDRTRAKQYATCIERLLMSEAGQQPPSTDDPPVIQCSSAPPSPPMSPALPLAPASRGRGAWALVGSLGVLSFWWMWLCTFEVPRPDPNPQQHAGKLHVMNTSATGAAGYWTAAAFSEEEDTSRSSASRCPAGWVAAEGAGPHGGARCFRVPRQLGTHYECATAICPGSSGADGEAHQATLATLGSAEESLRLFDSVGLTSIQQDLWIGLYRTSVGGGEPGRGAGTSWNNGTQLPDSWTWAADGRGTSEGEPAARGSWKAGQPDARFGREDCGYVSGTTGVWEDYGCDLREMRCLCELGASASPEYHTSMKVHAEEIDQAAAAQRVWVAVAIGASFALPMFLSSPESRHGSGDRGGSARRVALHLGTALFFWGFTPVAFHYGLGMWHGMQLGAWTTYPWLGCVGGFILCEALLPGQLWALAVAGSLIFLGLLAVSAQILFTTVIAPLAATGAVTARMAAMLGFWAGVALCNARCCYGLLAPLLRQSTTPYDLYRNNYHYGAINAKACGLALLAFFLGPLYAYDPDFAKQHPNSPGAAASGLVFVLLGFVAPRLGPAAGAWLLGESMGESSNEHVGRAKCACMKSEAWPQSEA